MSGKGTLHTGSVAYRLREFFAENPDEELDYAGVRAKFNCSDGAARCAVMKLTKRGVLESAHVIRLPGKGRAS